MTVKELPTVEDYIKDMFDEISRYCRRVCDNFENNGELPNIPHKVGWELNYKHTKY